MKQINFLIKLNKEKKLSIVEPSEDIKESYIQKSNNSLKSAIILLENSQIDDFRNLCLKSKSLNMSKL